MAKLARVTQQIYGVNGNASHFGQFGSKAIGAPVLTLDPASIQALSAFTGDGWLNAVVGANKQPFLEDMNGLFRVAFYQLGQIFQDGIPVWDAGTPYYIGSIVRKDGTFELYGSLTNANTGNTLPSQTNSANWQYLNPTSIAPGIMYDFGGSTAPFGYLLCDGTIYPQASYPALYAAISSTWNTYRGVSDPGVGNFRVPDLRGQTTIGAGQAPGLTNRVLGSFIGEENHVLTTTEIPSHSHSVSDPGHSHLPPGGGSFTVQGSSPLNTSSFGGTSVYGAASTAAETTGISIGSTGGGAGHITMQPSGAVNKIIKI